MKGLKFLFFIVFPLLCLSAFLIYGAQNYYNKLKEERKKMLGSIIQDSRDIKIYSYHKNNTLYYKVVFPLNMYIFPSGPPVFVYNEFGKCIDFTYDSGDDSKFILKWGLPYIGNEVDSLSVKITDS